MNEHEIDVIFDNGYKDDPAWKAVCGCGWEVWDCDTRDIAEQSHAQHALENGWIPARTRGRRS